MGTLVVSDNVSLDGVVQDPTGDEGFTRGGWVGQIAAKDRDELNELTLRRCCAPTPCYWVGGVTRFQKSFAHQYSYGSRRVIGRLDTGHWGDSTDAGLMNAEASALGPGANLFAVGTTVISTPPAFLRFRPTVFLRPFERGDEQG